MTSQKRMAAKIMKCGESRIWLDPSRSDEIASAITSEDVRRLIKDGIIMRKPATGTSNARAKILKSKKKGGLKKGHGSRKGKKTARAGSKKKWINLIRALRMMLKELKKSGSITNKDYWNLYKKAGGGFFRSRSHLKLYLEQRGVKADEEKKTFTQKGPKQRMKRADRNEKSVQKKG